MKLALFTFPLMILCACSTVPSAESSQGIYTTGCGVESDEKASDRDLGTFKIDVMKISEIKEAEKLHELILKEYGPFDIELSIGGEPTVIKFDLVFIEMARSGEDRAYFFTLNTPTFSANRYVAVIEDNGECHLQRL